jgi:methanol--5-hydroxybenzimidazolylcobamide Co-methyltransferase
MSMEGKTAACAHLSPVGNVAAAACDLWSNESVQNLRLLGAMAPVCSMEQLIYDCRLLNRAAQDGPAAARQLRDWMVEPDAALDPQAVVLTPDSAVAFAQTIASADSPYDAGRAVALQAVGILREAREQGALEIADRDARYLDIIEEGVTSLPDDEDAFAGQMMAQVDTTRFRPGDYGL